MPAREAANSTPTRAQRVGIAAVIGLLVAAFAGVQMARPGFDPDLAEPWTAARHLIAGADPYARMRPETGGDPLGLYFFYPLTAAVALLPLAPLTLPVAGAIALGLSAAALAYTVTRDALWRLHVFAGSSFVMAASIGQWSPLMMAATLAPWLGAAFAIKPTIGLAAFVYRPSWQAVAGCAALAALSVALRPGWPLEWLDVAQRAPHSSPLQAWAPWSFVLLLAAVRWRAPAARLLIVLACVPQLPLFADQLLLWLVPRTREESLALTAGSLAAFLGWYLTTPRGVPYTSYGWPWVLGCMYLPALTIVLRQPNEPGPR